MKFPCLPFVILGLAFFSLVAQAEIINGRSYVALGIWSRANGLGGYAFNQGTEWVFTNRTSRVVLSLDSADASINNIGVRLSYPVAKGGFISQLDADKTLRPLLFPQKVGARKITTICLDPGHGGNDTGNQIGHFFKKNEKTYTLALAVELQRQLQQAGFNVILTRDKDIYPKLPLPNRPEIANHRGADLFVSLHFNSSPEDAANVQGPETYCITPVGAASSNDAQGVGAGRGAYPANRCEDRSLLLAYEVQRSLVRGLGAVDRSVRRARWEVLRTATMPAILIEGGYMSHPVEGRRIFDEGWRKQLAAAVVRGILSYQKLTAPQPVPPRTVAASGAGAPARKATR